MNDRMQCRIPLTVLTLTLAIVSTSSDALAQATRDTSAAKPYAPCMAEVFPDGFRSATAQVNGTTLHYVVGGLGPALVLVHGFPQNWSAWAQIMPGLASRFRVVAVDLRGIGGSIPTRSGYEAKTMAEDVYQLAQVLGLDRPYVVGHDFGGWIAYAFARLHPDDVRGAMIIDVPIAGVDPWEEIKVWPELWHFGFHRTPGLAEKLLAGREEIYVDYFLRSSVVDPTSISDGDVERYACAYSKPGRMAAAMGMYRAFDDNERFGQRARGALDVPLVLVAGEESFGPLLPDIAKGLETVGVRNVMIEVISEAGHYPADEQPAATAALIESYALPN